MGQQYFPIHINHPDSHAHTKIALKTNLGNLFLSVTLPTTPTTAHTCSRRRSLGKGEAKAGRCSPRQPQLPPLPAPLPGLPTAPCQESFLSCGVQWELCVDKLSKSESAKFILGTGTHNCAESKGALPAPPRWQPASSGVNTLVRAPTKVKGHRMRPFIANCS